MFCKIVVLCNPKWDEPNVWHDMQIKIKQKNNTVTELSIRFLKQITEACEKLDKTTIMAVLMLFLENQKTE